MAHCNSNGAMASTKEVAQEIWLVDSGCSNHMTRCKGLFKMLDESMKLTVKFRDDNEMKVEGKGTVAITTVENKVKPLNNEQYVPNLAHSLLNVGQLLASGFAVTFDNGACMIENKESGIFLTKI